MRSWDPMGLPQSSRVRQNPPRTHRFRMYPRAEIGRGRRCRLIMWCLPASRDPNRSETEDSHWRRCVSQRAGRAVARSGRDTRSRFASPPARSGQSLVMPSRRSGRRPLRSHGNRYSFVCRPSAGRAEDSCMLRRHSCHRRASSSRCRVFSRLQHSYSTGTVRGGSAATRSTGSTPCFTEN